MKTIAFFDIIQNEVLLETTKPPRMSIFVVRELAPALPEARDEAQRASPCQYETMMQNGEMNRPKIERGRASAQKGANRGLDNTFRIRKPPPCPRTIADPGTHHLGSSHPDLHFIAMERSTHAVFILRKTPDVFTIVPNREG